MPDKKCIILTDDFFLYNGLKNLHPEIDLIMARLPEGYSEHKVSNVTSIIIDGRVLLSNSWKGFEMLMKTYREANIIWLFHRSVCGFLRCESFISCVCMHQELLSLKQDMLYRMGNQRRVVTSSKKLSAYEKKLLPYFVEGISFTNLAEFFSCSEKTLHTHRLNITLKFGFRSTCHMTFVLSRISPILISY